MKKSHLIIGMILLSTISLPAQETHMIEPTILEISYNSHQLKYDDSYILRVGKNVSQFFSSERYRFDSLMNSTNATMDIALHEFIASVETKNDKSKQIKSSTINREWLYQDKTTNHLSLYSEYSNDYKCYEEDIPTQEWTIISDSTTTILGMKCQKATTRFRGREWQAWFTEEIAVSLGPWKLGGLPGLILKAKADDSFISFEAVSIRNKGLNPVTFYNWNNEKFYKMTREKFLKYKNRPRVIPVVNKVLHPSPYIELE